MTRIDIGVSRGTALKLSGDLYTAFIGEDPNPTAGGLEYEFIAHDTFSGDQVVVRITNDDMEREEVKDEIYVEIANDAT